MKTIKLNLMLNYPVYWSKWQVLRDIVQNFYDDVGYEFFGKKFQYHYQESPDSNGKLLLSMKSIGFSYEWLVYAGTAIVSANKVKKANVKGYKIRYTIHHIEIKRHLLKIDCFMDAFATYCHELCHCFGGDASMAFSLALTDVIALTIQKQNVINGYQEQWRQLFQP